MSLHSKVLVIALVVFTFRAAHADQSTSFKAKLIAVCLDLNFKLQGYARGVPFSTLEKLSTKYGFKNAERPPNSNSLEFKGWMLYKGRHDDNHLVARYSVSHPEPKLPSYPKDASSKIPVFSRPNVFKPQALSPEGSGYYVQENWVREGNNWSIKVHYFATRKDAQNFVNIRTDKRYYSDQFNQFLELYRESNPEGAQKLFALVSRSPTLKDGTYQFLMDKLMNPEILNAGLERSLSDGNLTPGAARNLAKIAYEISKVHLYGVPELRSAGLDPSLNYFLSSTGKPLKNKKTSAAERERNIKAEAETLEMTVEEYKEKFNIKDRSDEGHTSNDEEYELFLANQNTTRNKVMGGLSFQPETFRGNVGWRLGDDGGVEIGINPVGVSEKSFPQLKDFFEDLKNAKDPTQKVHTLYNKSGEAIGYYVVQGTGDGEFRGLAFPALTDAIAVDPKSESTVTPAALDEAKTRARAYAAQDPGILKTLGDSKDNKNEKRVNKNQEILTEEEDSGQLYSPF